MRFIHVAGIACAVGIGLAAYLLVAERGHPGQRAVPDRNAGRVPHENVPQAGQRTGCRVQDRVLDPSGSPAVEAAVALAGALTRVGRTDASGWLEFVGVAPGEYGLRARGEGGEAYRALSLDGSREVTLKLVATENEVAMHGHRGRIEGVVVDDAGTPLSEVRVWASLRGHLPSNIAEAKGGRFASTMTDPEGRFALRGLADGTFRITARAPGFHGPHQDARANGPDLHFVLRRTVSVSGRVWGDGGPVAGATIRGKLSTARSTKFFGRATSDDDGWFTLDDLPPDQALRLRIEHEHFRTLEAGDVLRRPTEARTFILEPGVRVGGTVVDSRDEPVPGAAIRVLVDGRPAASVRSDAEGRWLVGGLDAGAVVVQVDATELGYVPNEPRSVLAGDTRIRLLVQAGQAIAGTLVEADGSEPSRPLRVKAFAMEGRVVSSTRVRRRDRGSFELRGLAPGTYTLRVYTTAGRIGQWAEQESVVAGVADLRIRLATTPMRRE